MDIGIPREIKTAEFRVALTPDGVAQLTVAGHNVVVEASAGLASEFPDDAYATAGAQVVKTAHEVWETADLVVKVKEPIGVELGYLDQRGASLTLFTYLHLAGIPGLAERLCSAGVTAVAYETVETDSGEFPLLAPMSEIAGKLAVHAGADYLRHPFGTKGILLSGGPGIPAANVTVIGAGVVGQNAARLAMAMGASVTLMNRSPGKLRQFMSANNPGSLTTVIASADNIATSVETSDLVIGAVYVAGTRAKHVVTQDMITTMGAGSVIVDVSIDQGGCVETSHPTTHEDPVFIVDDVIHYCVANMPGSVPRTATLALTNETFPYVMAIAASGIMKAARLNSTLAKGVNVYRGDLVNKAVAGATGLPYRALNDMPA
jgi:alanine dehydrogenase